MASFADLARQIIDQRDRRPAAPALHWEGRTVSYHQLADLITECRHQLRDSLGIQDVVAIAARKSPRAIALILAGFLEDRDLLLVSPGLGEETLVRLLNTARCHVLLSPGTHDALTRRVFGEPTEDALRHQKQSRTTCRLMLTTSGSTGPPKIVPLSAPAVHRFTDWAASRFDIGDTTSVLSYAPLNFDLALLDVWTTLTHGGCAALVTEDRAMDARHILSIIDSANVTIIQGVPTLFHLLSQKAAASGPLGRIRHIVITGDRIRAPTLKRIADLCPTAEISNVYGATETNDSFIHTVKREADDLDNPLPIGRPIAGVTHFLTNEDGRPLIGSGRGELWVSTPFQTEGYLASNMNSGRFVSGDKIVGLSATDRGRTFFRSGDLAQRLPDGLLVLEGRLDSMIKVSGARVNVSVIEQALLEHDGVVEVAVLAVADDLAVHRLHAVVAKEEASPLNSLELRRYCSRKLERAAVPSTISIQTRPLPRTQTGKIDRMRCLAEYQKDEVQ